jgi:uncharacterized membrane protein SpoIIM required for sporulation
LPFCTRCGNELLPTDNYCPRCGTDLRAPSQTEQPATGETVSGVRGLGRNSVVYVGKDGLRSLQIRSDITLFLAFILPIPVLATVYYLVQAGALALYLTVWLAASGLIYDALRLQGLRSLDDHSPNTQEDNNGSRSFPWNSIRMADWNGRTLWLSSTWRKFSATFDPKDAPTVQQNLTAHGVRYSWRGPRLPSYVTRFTTLAIIFFIVSQVILISAAILPFLPGEEDVYRTVLNSTQSQLAGVSFLDEFRGIFLNNIQIALGGAIPFLGTIGFGIASYSTGRVIQVIAIDRGVSAARILLTLYILPHTWVEESAYPIAAVAGILGVTKWRSVTPEDFRNWRKWGSTKLVLALGGAGLILLVAGLIETLTTHIGIPAVTLWVPLLVGYYLVVQRYRKAWRGSAAATS